MNTLNKLAYAAWLVLRCLWDRIRGRGSACGLIVAFTVLALATPAHAACYWATVKSVYDGDTITADIVLGFNVTMRNERVRILYIDAPEVRGAERPYGIVSRDALAERINGEQVNLCTRDGERERDNFGRVLATIEHDGEDIGQWLISQGLAVPYE